MTVPLWASHSESCLAHVWLCQESYLFTHFLFYSDLTRLHGGLQALALLRSNTPRLQLAGIDLLAVMAQDSTGREAVQGSDTHLMLSGMLHDENERAMATAALRTLLECKAYSLADLETAGVDEAIVTRLRASLNDKAPRPDAPGKPPLTGTKAWRMLFNRTGTSC